MSRAHLAQALVSVAIDAELDSSSIAAATQAFFEGPLATLWDKISNRYTVYSSSVASDEVFSRSMQEYYQIVKQAFLSFASVDSKTGPQLSIEGLFSLLYASTLVDKEQEGAIVDAFLQSQLLPSSPEQELSHLVFCEFFEALMKVTLFSIGSDSGLSEAKRLRMGFGLVSEIQNISRSGGK